MATLTPHQYAAERNWCFKEKMAKPRAVERRILRDEVILQDAAGRVVLFDRDDIKNTTNLTGVGSYYDSSDGKRHAHRGMLQVLLEWGVATITPRDPANHHGEVVRPVPLNSGIKVQGSYVGRRDVVSRAGGSWRRPPSAEPFDYDLLGAWRAEGCPGPSMRAWAEARRQPEQPVAE